MEETLKILKDNIHNAQKSLTIKNRFQVSLLLLVFDLLLNQKTSSFYQNIVCTYSKVFFGILNNFNLVKKYINFKFSKIENQKILFKVKI